MQKQTNQKFREFGNKWSLLHSGHLIQHYYKIFIMAALKSVILSSKVLSAPVSNDIHLVMPVFYVITAAVIILLEPDLRWIFLQLIVPVTFHLLGKLSLCRSPGRLDRDDLL